MTQTADASVARVLSLVRSGIATRTELVAELGWSRVTLARRIDELQAAGLVVSDGQGASGGGRPAERLVVAPDAGRILALDIGGSHSRLAIADFAGTLLLSLDADLGRADGPDAVFAWARGCLADAEVVLSGGRLLAIGAGLPCPVDEHGVVSSLDDPRWNGVDVAASLGIDAVTAVDRDVNVLAIAESRLASQHADLVVVKVGLGVGAAVIAGGGIRRGSHGRAGSVTVAAPGASTDAAPASLEDVASGRTVIAALTSRGIDAPATSAALARLAAVDDAARELVGDLGAAIGRALAPAISVLDPSAVLVGGNLADADAALIEPLATALRASLQPAAAAAIEVSRTQLGHEAGLLGAALIAIDACTSAERIHELLGDAQQTEPSPAQHRRTA